MTRLGGEQDQGRQALGHAGLALRLGDQVLADLELEIVEAAGLGVAGDGVVDRIHGVGLVVADHQIAGAVQRFQHPQRGRRVMAVQHSDMPRPLQPVHRGREAVDRDQQRPFVAVQGRGDGGVVGRVDGGDAIGEVTGGEAGIAGNGRGVRDGRRDVGAFRVAVAVDHQSRIGLHHQLGMGPIGQAARQGGRADVPGDVTLQVRRLQAQLTQPPRNQPTGVIANQQQRCGGA